MRGKTKVKYDGPTAGGITVPCPYCLKVYGVHLRRHMQTCGCPKSDERTLEEVEPNYHAARIYMTEWTQTNVLTHEQIRVAADSAGLSVSDDVEFLKFIRFATNLGHRLMPQCRDNGVNQDDKLPVQTRDWEDPQPSSSSDNLPTNAKTSRQVPKKRLFSTDQPNTSSGNSSQALSLAATVQYSTDQPSTSSGKSSNNVNPLEALSLATALAMQELDDSDDVSEDLEVFFQRQYHSNRPKRCVQRVPLRELDSDMMMRMM